MKNSFFLLPLLGLLLACQDDEDTNNFELPASIVRFSSSEATSVEGSGYQQVALILDRPQEGKTLLHFSISGNFSLAEAGRAGDIRMITESPLLIEAGETEAFIEFEVLEDFDFEAQAESITITLNDVLEGNVVLSSQADDRIYQHQILENEYELSLEWDQSETDYTNVDLVVEQPNKVLIISDNTDGFEKVILTNVHQNTTYLVTVWYYQGNSPVNYDLLYRKSGSKSILLEEGSFQTGEANREFSLSSSEGTRHYKMTRSGSEMILLER